MDWVRKIQELELEVQKLKSKIRIDGQESSFREQLVFLSKTALDFLNQAEHPDLYEYIGIKFMELLRHSVVIVSSYEVECSELHVQYIGGIDGFSDKVFKVLGKKPLQQKVKLTEKTLLKMYENTNKLYLFQGGLHESSDGALSKTVSHALEKLFKANEMYGIVFERNGQIYGTATIITTGQQRVEEPRLLEAFIFQCSIALHRQQLELELREAKKDAEELSKLKTTFLANMSHEIRTPMNGILGLTNLLSNQNLDSETQKEYLKLITSSGNVLLSLLDGIMDISRIGANQVIINKENFNINELLHDLKMYYRSELLLLGKNDIQLSSLCPFSDEEAWIYADQLKIRQILVNLIGNAIKFTDTGRIEFGYKLGKKNELLFHVMDTGPGIKSAHHDMIFEQFVQGDNSSTRQHGGSGLGLSISKGFLDLMGGKIWLQSSPPIGSTFFFTLPFERKLKDSGGTALLVSGRKVNNWENYTILIVEDDHINYLLLERVLQNNKARVLHARTGREAVDICMGKKKPDLVLMDLQLPEMNGMEAIREIRKILPDLPIIVQTANALSEEKDNAVAAGCQGFITKPINLGKFIEEVGKHLQEV